MKREFLKNFKIGDAELPKEIIDAILDENSRDIDTAKKPFADYDGIKQQLTDANKAIEEFKGMDVESVQKAAEEWKAKFEQSEKDRAADKAAAEFNSLLSNAITTANGKSAKAISALLDVEALKTSKNQSEDIKAALDGLKQESGYLFEAAQTPPPYAAGTGSAPIGGVTKESFAKMGYRDRLDLKKTDPKTYESMKE